MNLEFGIWQDFFRRALTHPKGPTRVGLGFHAGGRSFCGEPVAMVDVEQHMDLEDDIPHSPGVFQPPKPAAKSLLPALARTGLSHKVRMPALRPTASRLRGGEGQSSCIREYEVFPGRNSICCR